jgi:PleD family two-component response regulator
LRCAQSVAFRLRRSRPSQFVEWRGAAAAIGVEISRALENKRIFVIDSDEATRAAIQFMLHDENEAHELASVAEAIARADGRKVDLVVLGRAIVREQGLSVFDQVTQGIPMRKTAAGLT